MTASWWDQVTASPLSKRPNMPLPSIYRLQTRSRAQFCVNKSARCHQHRTDKKSQLSNAQRFLGAQKLLNAISWKVQVSKLLLLVDGGGASRYFCPGVLLLWQLGGANDPRSWCTTWWCTASLVMRWTSDAHTGMHTARTEMHRGMHTQMCLVLIGRHSSSFKGHKAAQERSFRIFPDLTTFRTFWSYWLLQFK